MDIERLEAVSIECFAMARARTDPVALASGPETIKFNNKTYTSWRRARAAYHSVSAKGKVGSVWTMVPLRAWR
jgi:hypothetical protein